MGDVIDPVRPLMLPAFPPETSIAAAITGMKSLERSGIVMSDGKRTWIITAGNLLLARKTGLKTLSRITARQEVQDLTSQRDDAKVYRSTLPADHVLSEGAGPGRALFVTLSAARSKQLSSPSDCYCTGDPQHSLPPPPAKDGDKCPYGDGATVVCE